LITIINYGSGNIGAISTIYKKLNIPYQIANSAAEVLDAEKLILPGVGDFDETMQLLKQANLTEAIAQKVTNQNTPLVGVCVGMQVLGLSSAEGELPGFNFINGTVEKLPVEKLTTKPHLPHMGWNTINVKKPHQLLEGINHEKGFYFLHSYYFNCANEQNVLATVNYGLEFPVVVNQNNVFGIQFHPEKSHDNGIQVFKNFASL
jgi:imidazole glycerol-phosphate synthase subunit HisH